MVSQPTPNESNTDSDSLSMDLLHRISYRLLNPRSSLDGGSQPSIPPISPPARSESSRAQKISADHPPTRSNTLRRAFNRHRPSSSIKSLSSISEAQTIAHAYPCPVHTHANAKLPAGRLSDGPNGPDGSNCATGACANMDDPSDTNMNMDFQPNTYTYNAIYPPSSLDSSRILITTNRSVTHTRTRNLSEHAPFVTMPLAEPADTPSDSMGRQRSFLRSITNHASLSALRSKTWKRKAVVIPVDEGQFDTVGSRKNISSGTLSIRRLRRWSDKHTKITQEDVPPLPNSATPKPGYHSVVCIPAESDIGRSRSNTIPPLEPATPIKTPALTVAPPSPPTAPFLRRLRNRPPTEVALEFGTKGSPQSDRVISRARELSILSHRRHKSADIPSNTASTSASACPSRGSSIGPVAGRHVRDQIRGNATPIPDEAYRPLGTESVTPVNSQPTSHSSHNANDTAEISLGSFDINVLDQLLESEREIRNASTVDVNTVRTATLSRISTESRATSHEGSAKHTRHSDVFGPTDPVGYSTLANVPHATRALSQLSQRSQRSSQRSAERSIRPTFPVDGPASTTSIGSESAASSIVSDVDDGDVIAFPTDESRFLEPITADNNDDVGESEAEAEARVGLLHVEETTENGESQQHDTETSSDSVVGDSGDAGNSGCSVVSSPLDTDIETPTDLRPSSMLSAEHERAWAAFASLPDEDDDFQAVTDEEPFLSYRAESHTSSSQRASWAESEESFGAQHPYHFTSLSTIAEVSIGISSGNLSSIRSSTALSRSTERSESTAHGLPVPTLTLPIRRMHASAPPNNSPSRASLDPELKALKENQVVQKRIKELEFSLEQVRSALVANEESFDNLHSAHNELKHEHEKLQDEYGKQRVKKDEEEQLNHMMAQAIGDLREKYAIQVEAQEAVQEELRLAQKLLAEHSHRLAQADLELNTKDALIHQLQQEVKSAQFAADEARVLYETEKEEHDKAVALAEQAIAERDAAIKEQDGAWKTAGYFKDELDDLKERSKAEHAEYLNWTAERDDMDKRYAILQKELEICDRNLAAEDQRAYRAEEVTIPRLQERIESLTTLLREATCDLSPDESLRSQNSAIDTVVDQETDLIALRRAVESKEVELQDVSTQFERHKRACRRDMGDLREDIASHKEEIKALKAEFTLSREETETHRSRAADYFQRNKSCIAELERSKLMSQQWQAENADLLARLSNSTMCEAALENRIAQLEEHREILEQHLMSKDFEVGMLRRQSQPPTPRGKRSLSRSVSAHARSPVSRLKDRDSPSPINKKLRLKRLTKTSPSEVFPDPESQSEKEKTAENSEKRTEKDKDKEKDKATPLTPTAKHNSVPPGSAPPSPPTKPKSRSHSHSHSRPPSVRCGLPVPKNRKQKKPASE